MTTTIDTDRGQAADVAITAASVEHRWECDDSSRYRTRLRDNTTLVTCISCGRSRPLASTGQDEQQQEPSTETIEPTINLVEETSQASLEPIQAADWRCSQHLEQRVSWHGRGCPVCGEEVASYYARRAQRRAVARARLARREQAATSPRGRKPGARK